MYRRRIAPGSDNDEADLVGLEGTMTIVSNCR